MTAGPRGRAPRQLARKTLIAQRRTKMLEYLNQGLTLTEISKRFNVTYRTVVYDYHKELDELAAAREKLGRRYLDRQLVRLEALYEHWRGKSQIDIDAAVLLLKVIDQQNRLLNLYPTGTQGTTDTTINVSYNGVLMNSDQLRAAKKALPSGVTVEAEAQEVEQDEIETEDWTESDEILVTDDVIH